MTRLAIMLAAGRFEDHFYVRLEKDGSFSHERDFFKIGAALRRCGYFCLLTNTGLGPLELLAK